MEFLPVSHNIALVAASLLIALVAGFTGLTLTRNIADKPLGRKKLAVAMAAIALGGGIWSMHFVAMLGLQLPLLFYYDAAVTLASALLAILLVGVALILLHFAARTPLIIVLAGGVVAFGILAMHYIGMAGLELCRAVYSAPGIMVAVFTALVLCVAAFWVAYGTRSTRNILFGTLCFGAAVFAVHFVAIAGTRFVAVASFSEFGPVMSNETLAIGVILSSFVIFGAFLWVSATFIATPEGQVKISVDPNSASAVTPAEVLSAPAESGTAEMRSSPVRIPCEKDGGKIFVSPQDVAIIRADGHYTQIYTEEGRLFCVWPITEANKRLLPEGLLRVHRSYLVNPLKVTTFERRKDKGFCSFASAHLPQVPVSRSKLKSVQAALGAD